MGVAVSPISIDRLLELLVDPQSVLDLRKYFGIRTLSGSPVFSGSDDSSRWG